MKLFTSVLVLAGIVSAHAAVLHGTDNASVYTNFGNINHGFLVSSGMIQGVVKFSLATVTAPFSSATLALDPYALPWGDFTVDVYGIQANSGTVTVEDGNAGTYLGVLNVPQPIHLGEQFFFDVTSFVAGSSTPFVGFNLRTDGGNHYSSVFQNYGHGPELIITTVPEPASIAAFLPAILLFRRRRCSS